MTTAVEADATGIKGRIVDSLMQNILDQVIRSLGESISKTIMWHMNNSGVFSRSTRFDIKDFYSNLSELIGPGVADMIMELTAEQLQTHCGKAAKHDVMRSTPLESIQRMLEGEA